MVGLEEKKIHARCYNRAYCKIGMEIIQIWHNIRPKKEKTRVLHSWATVCMDSHHVCSVMICLLLGIAHTNL